MSEALKNSLFVASVVQIRPDFKSKCFAGCLLVVTEVKSWGVQGYIQSVGPTFDESIGQCYLRLNWDDFEPTGGIAPWIIGSAAEDASEASD